MDLGIIQAFKIQYRKYLLQFFLTRIGECAHVFDLTKKVSLKEVITWLVFTWKGVKTETIAKCFATAGTCSDFSVPENTAEIGPTVLMPLREYLGIQYAEEATKEDNIELFNTSLLQNSIEHQDIPNDIQGRALLISTPGAKWSTVDLNAKYFSIF